MNFSNEDIIDGHRHWDTFTFGLIQLQYEDSGSEFCDEDALRKGSLPTVAALKAHRLDLSEIFFSNEEYYRKLEALKKAHLQTMADLESMYQEKLLLNSTEAAEVRETGPRWGTLVCVYGHL